MVGCGDGVGWGGVGGGLGLVAKTKDYPGTVYWSVKAAPARGPVILSDTAALKAAQSWCCFNSATAVSSNCFCTAAARPLVI